MKNKEQNKQPEKIKQDISQKILGRIEEFVNAGELVLPKDYSAANAIKSAMLILAEAKDRNNKPVLEVCTQTSIAQSMLKMVVQGLSPMKNQGYFIPYGTELQWSRSYQGSVALAKRVANVKDVVANVVYNGDEFEYGIDPMTGYKKIIKHTPSMDNIANDQIKGAYAVILYTDGRVDVEVMTIEEIHTAWRQGATKGESPAHKKFPQEMAKKTVINRACKGPINSSSDLTILGVDPEPVDTTEDIGHEVLDETASTPIDFKDTKEKEKETEPVDTAPKTEEKKEPGF